MSEDKEKKSKEIDYGADDLPAGTIAQIVSDFYKTFDESVYTISYVDVGLNYDKSVDFLNKLIVATTSGPHMEFYRKNKWLLDPKQRTAYTNAPWLAGNEDKRLVMDFYALVHDMSEFRKKFEKCLSGCISDALFPTYHICHFKMKMYEKIKDADMHSIMCAFAEFDNVIKTFNDSSIYNRIPIYKPTNPEEQAENYETVLDYMDEALVNKKNLCKFLLNTKATAAVGINELYVMDRDTKKYDDYASKVDRIKRSLNECAELKTEASGYYGRTNAEFNRYFDAYIRVLDILIKVFESAIKVVDDFKTRTNEAPYSVMHYDPLVADCANKHYLGSTPDPLTNGTNYSKLATAMLDRCRELAKTVAKLAPPAPAE